MINSTYARAYTEVLEIIRHFPEEELSKIPVEKIEFYKNNMDKNYIFRINPEIDLAEQNISPEANAIIVTLFRDYYATNEQKLRIKEILNLNQIQEEDEKRKKYNPDDIFKKVSKEKNVNNDKLTEYNNTALIEYKEPFFIRFKNFIFRLLHINNL